MSDNLIDQLKEFKKAHYLNANFDYWFRKINLLNNKLKRVKDKERQSLVILELYTSYIQMLEILFINIFAISRKDDGFPDGLFINSANLRKFIEDNFLRTTHLSSWFIKSCILQLQQDDKDYIAKYQLHTNLLKECAKDYLEDFDLLNAYKHGYRLQANYSKSTMSIITGTGQGFLLDEADSTLSYFTKEKTEDLKIIYKKTINFKNSRIFGKAIFTWTLLHNMRVTILLSYGVKRKYKLAWFNINSEEWGKTIGRSKVKEAVFSLK